jgi:hypothetical protein
MLDILGEVRAWLEPCGQGLHLHGTWRFFPKGIEKHAFSYALDGHAVEDWTRPCSS